MLRKLRAAIQPTAPAGSGSSAGQPTAVMLSGGLEVGVVGESHHQDALTAMDSSCHGHGVIGFFRQGSR